MFINNFEKRAVTTQTKRKEIEQIDSTPMEREKREKFSTHGLLTD